MVEVTILMKNGVLIAEKAEQQEYTDLSSAWAAYLGGLRKGRLVVLHGAARYFELDAEAVACISARSTT